jgi:hypothetical protein
MSNSASLANPFVPNRALQHHEALFGRRELLQRLLRRLREGTSINRSGPVH